jgi:diguanylate cyclase (GGDEF)-like protein
MAEFVADARREAQRLEALWRIVNRPNLRGDDLVLAMLDEAAGSMRPGHAFAGTLGHIEGSHFVIDAVAGHFGAGGEAAWNLLPFGRRLERSETLTARDLDAGRTQAWNDCQTLADLPPLARAGGLRSQITTQFAAGGTTYVLTFGSCEAPLQPPFGSDDFSYIELLGSFFARHIDLEFMQHSLIGAELRAREHAQRLEALWKIAGNQTLAPDELLLAILRQAAATIRPAQCFRGYLSRLEGDEIVVVGVGAAREDAVQASSGLQINQRNALSDTMIPRMGRTTAWEDAGAIPDPPPQFAALGWRAIIATRFTAAGNDFILTFASQEPSAVSFGAEDLAYVDVLASLFAKQLEMNALAFSLRGEQARSREHAERLEALLQIAAIPTLRGEQLMRAMLRQAAAGIRPLQRFGGILGSIDGDDVTIISLDTESFEEDTRSERIRPGRRTPLKETIVPFVGLSQAWDDLGEVDFPPAVEILGWRAAMSTRFEAGGANYSLTFFAYEPASPPFSTEDTAYLDVLAASFAKQLEVNQLEDSLRDEEEHSRRHAERLETLWKIVNDPELRDTELFLVMLRESAARIRPDQAFSGMLWRVEGSDLIVEALAEGEDSFGSLPSTIGEVIPLADTLAGKVIAANAGTRSWDDVTVSGESSVHTEALGTRSLIITTFRAGGTTWGLLFASNQAATRPLDRQDHAYVEVVASFFANHVQQRWQFERIRYQQSHDVLTGLLNRSQFRSQARAAARTNARYAIILVGVDAFREVNESYGHMVGDALLVEVGNALARRAASDEIVGRIGGDIFGIYIANPVDLEAVRERALIFAGAFTSPFSTGDDAGVEFVSRTASLGLSVSPDDGTMLDAILSHADAALVSAKRAGHGSIRIYEPEMEGEASRRTSMRNELAEAVATDQFVLYFQPHIELRSGTVSGCEVLIRWNHPTRGLLLPQHFIPFAEQSGMIAAIDTWVMQQSFAASKALLEVGPDFRLYFNLSGRQAGDARLIRAFVEAARNGVALEHIGVEITETDAMRDVDATRRVCRALRRLNVRIAIDDFGTGYSSLSSLKQLPVDIVKIDRSFISGVLTDPHDATIADTIMTIAARFGFDSLAEGVETLAQIGWLRERPCRYMQGYAICHPLPLADFKRWLAGHEA